MSENNNVILAICIWCYKNWGPRWSYG